MNGSAQIPAPAKNIVIFSDGTGNSDIKDRGTNVFKMFEAVDLNGHFDNPPLKQQIAFYDDGVGTESLKPLKILGGAFGWGLSRNVKQLYAALVRSYNPGDSIYLFGFSRGAFTARSIGGFITSCGILNHNEYKSDDALVEAVNQAYKVYRSRYMTGVHKDLRSLYKKIRPANNKPSRFEKKRDAFHAALKNKIHTDVKIAFIGAWDTVDAVGFPIAHVADLINYFIYPFKFADHSLNPKVEQARHALSIDDERHTFHPLLWDETAENSNRIKQVWFAGVHANVGGGYPKQGMSLTALSWMINEAENAGLRILAPDKLCYYDHESVNDKLYNSRAGAGMYYRYKPRDIYQMCKASKTTPKIHETVIDRIAQRTEGYAPGNLPREAEIVASQGNVARYPTVSAALTKAYGAHTSLLDFVRPQIRLRRMAHHIYFALTLVALWVAYQPVMSGSGMGALSAAMDANVRDTVINALKTDRLFDGLAIAIAVFFLIALRAERKMRNTFSEFWYTSTPTLLNTAKLSAEQTTPPKEPPRPQM
ncbi:MAG: DUF2235 domain-containing protein [Burkholderiaceae bacterium]|nr:MAG: DUF2235 domain-containing protein [Burkholderiaceae bacterium]